MKQTLPIFFFSIMLLTACKEKYLPSLTNESPNGYLVVEGFINSGSGPTAISLSRSTKLSASPTIVRETKAVVRVEGKKNTAGFALTETPAASGIYIHPQLTLSPNDQYRLHIKTVTGKEYYSDFSDVRSTPDIDSISWKVENDGVQCYGESHDSNVPVGYYQIKKEETWEFVSTYTSALKILFNAMGSPIGVTDRFPGGGDDLSMYRCWKTEVPTNILLYSTEKLSQNVVHYPLAFIEPGSWKLGIQYSINLTLIGISRANYQFLEQLRKNTEQLGSIFDAQPSENKGNIHNPINPDETVIGFVEVTEEKQKRIFISNAQVPFWTFRNTCGREKQVIVFPTSDVKVSDGIPTHYSGFVDSKLYAGFVDPICVDCTLRGSNKKPAFW